MLKFKLKKEYNIKLYKSIFLRLEKLLGFNRIAIFHKTFRSEFISIFEIVFLSCREIRG